MVSTHSRQISRIVSVEDDACLPCTYTLYQHFHMTLSKLHMLEFSCLEFSCLQFSCVEFLCWECTCLEFSYLECSLFRIFELRIYLCRLAISLKILYSVICSSIPLNPCKREASIWQTSVLWKFSEKINWTCMQCWCLQIFWLAPYMGINWDIPCIDHTLKHWRRSI